MSLPLRQMLSNMKATVLGLVWLLLLPALIVAGTNVAATQGTHYDAGIAFYKKKIKADAQDFLSAISLGEMYTSRARVTGDVIDYQQAEKVYRRSLQIMPKHNIEAKVGLAASLGSQHRFKEADKIAKEALAESPGTSALLAIAGDVAFDLGDYERAAGTYQFYAKQQPGLASWSRVAKIEMLKGNAEAAGKLWEQCCALPVGSDPEPAAWAWVMRGGQHLGKGEFQEANKCYEQALRILPGFPLALEHVAEIALIEKNHDKAISLYRKAIASSNNPGLLVFLGDAFEKAGKHDSAAVAWKKGEKAYRALLEKGNIGYLRPLATFYLDQELRPAKALELAKEDLNIRQDFGAYLTLGRAYLQLGKKKEALEAIQKAAPVAEYDAQYCYHAGKIQQANGNEAEAQRLFARIMNISPGFDRIFGTNTAVKLSSLSK